ncbi:MAG: M14 family zinc carboxypeptidase [Burkholderiales bacterium]
MPTTNAGLEEALHAFERRRVESGAPLFEVLNFGRSASGRSLLAIRVSGGPGIEFKSLPNVLVVAQQRGDQPAGAEALLTLAQRAQGGELADVLRRVNVVLVPRLNPDGAESARPASEERIDITTDHLALRSNEAWGFAGLVRDLDPELVVELRDYDAAASTWSRFGATPAASVMVDYGATPAQPALITRAAEEWFLRPLAETFVRKSIAWDWYYAPAPQRAGLTLSMGSANPDNLSNVMGLRGAVSLSIAVRAAGRSATAILEGERIQLVAIRSVLDGIAGRADDLSRVRRYERATIASQECRGEIVLDAEPTRSGRTVSMLDSQTGVDKTVAVEWQSSRVLEMRRLRPRPCGYWIAASASASVQHLRRLGVRVQELRSPANVLGSMFKERDAGGSTPVEADTVDALIDMPAGSFFVSLDQPLANLAVAALARIFHLPP